MVQLYIAAPYLTQKYAHSIMSYPGHMLGKRSRVSATQRRPMQHTTQCYGGYTKLPRSSTTKRPRQIVAVPMHCFCCFHRHAKTAPPKSSYAHTTVVMFDDGRSFCSNVHSVARNPEGSGRWWHQHSPKVAKDAYILGVALCCLRPVQVTTYVGLFADGSHGAMLFPSL